MTDPITLVAPARGPVFNLTPTVPTDNSTTGFLTFTSTSHFMSHDNRRINYQWMWVYGWNNVRREVTAGEYVILVRLDECPAAAECTDGHHHLILHARFYDGRYYIRDLNNLILHDWDMVCVDALANGTDLNTAIHNTVTSHLMSMQSATMRLPGDSNHGLVVYNTDTATLMRRLPNNSAYPVLYVPPSRWLVGRGEAERYHADGASWLALTPESEASLRSMWGEATMVQTEVADPPTAIGTIEAPVHTPGEDVPLPSMTALADTVTDLRTQLEATLTSLRQREQVIEDLTNTIDHAKAVAQRYTLDNNGCDDGKRRFLTDLGLHDEDEVDGMFDRDYIVYVSVPVSTTANVAVTVRASSADLASDMVNDDPESYIDLNQVIENIEASRYNTEVEFSAAEVTETEYA